MAVATSQSFSDYDPLAWFYDLYWGPASRDQLMPVLQEVLLDELSEGARILDLCCGTGQLSASLAEAGYTVTGIDGSRAMLAYARNNAPEAEFRRDDARTFSLEEPVDAVVCTYESLNHLMQDKELVEAFSRMEEALRDDGYLVFDLNMAEAYGPGWQGTDGLVEADHVLFTENETDQEAKVGTSEVTLFRFANGAWRRSDLVLEHRWYDEEVVLDALAEAGFGTAAIYEAIEDLGLTGETGRRFFLVQKAELEPDEDA